MVEQLELTNTMLRYSISEFRANPAYVKICEAHCIGLQTIQDAVDYLSNCLDMDKAEGIWLDYIAWLVGTTRNATALLRFFCLNVPHLNVEKYFYFPGLTDFSATQLDDAVLRQRIKATIGYNTSRGTREENLRILKGISNADLIKIEVVEPMSLDVTLAGDNIIYPSIGNLRENMVIVLPNGVGIRRLTILTMAQGEELFNLELDELKSELRDKIREVTDFKDSVVVSADGSDVDSTNQWITAGEMAEIELAIKKAEELLLKSDLTKTDLYEGISDISTVKDNIKAKTGINKNKTTLAEKILEYETFKNGLKVSENGYDIYTNEQWVTQSDMNIIEQALEEAKQVLAKSFVSDEDLQSAISSLETAKSNVTPSNGTKPIE